MRAINVAIAILLSLTSPTWAVDTGFPLMGVSSGAASYTGPGDVVSGSTAWYGLRAYSSTLANAGATTTPVIDVLGVVTATGCTIYLKGAGTGELDFSTAGAGGVGNQCPLGATTFCTVTNTSCTISKVYDQTANNACTSATCNVVQATAADQATLAFSCIGSLPCLQNAQTSGHKLQSATSFAANATETYTSVINYTSVTSGQEAILAMSTGSSADNLGCCNTSSTIQIGCNGTNTTQAASSATWYAQTGVATNSASSVISANGTSTTGSTSNCSSGSGIIVLFGISTGNRPFGGDWTESGLWDNVTFTSTQITNITSNERTYWGF